MAAHSAAATEARPRGLQIALGVRAKLGCIVAASFLVRALAAVASSTPTFFPDEYIYAAIARSIADTGRPLVRGGAAHFPALLEPIVAAPLWALAPTEVAYHLVQVENALFMSLAAVPAYLLARRLRLSPAFGLACAVFAVALPDLGFSAYGLADPVAYPLVVGALYAGVVALESPRRAPQLAFLALAGLAAFARIQYVVLVPAFLTAAGLLDGRRALRAQRLPLAVVGGAAAAGLAAGAGRVLGYYSAVTDLHVGLGLVRWAAVDLFVLALVSGVVLVPGAVVALARPRGRGETAFALLAGVVTLALLVEAGVYASNGSQRFQERYLFSLLPLIPIAFGVYLRRGRPARLPVALLAALLLALSARLPLSGYAAGTGSTDSPFLAGVLRVERIAGVGAGAAVVAVCAALAAVGAVVVAWRGGGRAAIAASLAFLIAASVAGTAQFVSEARLVRDRDLPVRATWVDDRGLGEVTALQTPFAPAMRMLQQLYWNRSITRELVLDDAVPTDAFAVLPASVARDGTLRVRGGAVRAPLLVQEYAVTAELENATLLERAGTFSLWRPHAPARLRLLAVGRFSDGWLAHDGRLTIWPAPGEAGTHGELRFTLSLPHGRRPVTLRIGREHHRLVAGERLPLRYRVDQAEGPWSLSFTAADGTYAPDLRPISVRSTPPVFLRRDS